MTSQATTEQFLIQVQTFQDNVNKEFFLPKILFIYDTQIRPIVHNRLNFGDFKKNNFGSISHTPNVRISIM